MNRVMKFGAAMSLGSFLAACATVAPDPDLGITFVPVQAHQMGDPGLSCSELSARITDTEHSVSSLDKQIKADQQRSQSLMMAAAFSGFAGAFSNNALSANLADASSSLGDRGAVVSGQEAMTKAQLRANVEERHNVLMQIFYNKRCTTS